MFASEMQTTSIVSSWHHGKDYDAAPAKKIASRQWEYLLAAAKIAKRSSMRSKHGCVIVNNGEIVASAYNRELAICYGKRISQHAEELALQSCKKSLLRDAELYVVRVASELYKISPADAKISYKRTYMSKAPVKTGFMSDKQYGKALRNWKYQRLLFHKNKELKKHIDEFSDSDSSNEYTGCTSSCTSSCSGNHDDSSSDDNRDMHRDNRDMHRDMHRDIHDMRDKRYIILLNSKPCEDICAKQIKKAIDKYGLRCAYFSSDNQVITDT